MTKILINKESLKNGISTRIAPNSKMILRCSETYFFINEKLAKALKINAGDYVVFYFCQSEKKFSIAKDVTNKTFKISTNLTKSGVRYRFQSKGLRELFIDFFKVTDKEKLVFECCVNRKNGNEFFLKSNFRKVKQGKR